MERYEQNCPVTWGQAAGETVTDWRSTIGTSFFYKQIEIFVGWLTHVSYLLPQLKCYLCGLYRMKKDWKQKLARRSIPEDVRGDLLFWRSTLSSFKHLRLIASPEPIDISWVGDASTSYGIGVLVGKSWTQFKTTPTWESADDNHKHIDYLETVAIHIGLIMVLKLFNCPGSHVVVWTGNTTAQAAVTNGKSKNKAVNNEWKIIQHLLILHQIDIHAKRVTSKDNSANELSRGSRGDCVDSDRFLLYLPTDIAPYFVSS